MGIKKIMDNEKKNMNSIRWKVNYVLVPIFLGVMVIIFSIVGITMSIDEEKYTPLAILLISIFGLMCVGLLSINPFIRKQEIKIEVSKYNFDKVVLENNSFYEFTPCNENTVVIFKEKTLEINGKDYDYSCFDIMIISSNSLNKINLTVLFTLQNSGREHNPYLVFELDGRMISVLDKFNIMIKNRDVLDFIINNKEEAFKQIYNYGYVKSLNKQ